MKINRQELILALIQQQDVETQEQLLVLLEQKGIHTTQATISRDIKQLHIIKELSPSGNYRYRASVKPVEHAFNAKLNLIFKQCVTSLDYAQNMIVIKTMPGLASAACAALDKVNYPEVIGTLAGDDTCFVVVRDAQAAAGICAEIKEIIH